MAQHRCSIQLRNIAKSLTDGRWICAIKKDVSAVFIPRVGFIVTNLETDSRAVVRFYNKRGTAEQWIKEGKQAVKMRRLSCSSRGRQWQQAVSASPHPPRTGCFCRN